MDFTTPITSFVAGFPDFIIQLGVALGLYVAALVLYVLMTPHKELKLINEGNGSASLAFAGVVVGLAIPLGSCLAHSFGVFDLLIWGVVTLLVQLLAFRITDMFLRKLPKRIADNDVAAAVFLLSVKIGLALILSGAVADPNVAMIRG